MDDYATEMHTTQQQSTNLTITKQHSGIISLHAWLWLLWVIIHQPQCLLHTILTAGY